jgi:hypothetical protein
MLLQGFEECFRKCAIPILVIMMRGVNPHFTVVVWALEQVFQVDRREILRCLYIGENNIVWFGEYIR